MTEHLDPDDFDWLNDAVRCLRDHSMKPDRIEVGDGTVWFEFDLEGGDS